jgi:signal transduction histidine kinase/sensor domain CHASE-containing protein
MPEKISKRLFQWTSFSTVRSTAMAVMLFCMGFIVSYWVATLQHGAHVNRLRDRVTLKIDYIRNNLSRELYSNSNLAQGLVDLLRIQGGMQQAQFDAMACELTGHSGLIRNVALAPGNVVRFIYPLRGNEKALGLNYLKTPEQTAAVTRAMAERHTIIAGPVNLVQGGIGIIVRTPVFIRDSLDNRKTGRYWGMASTVIDFDTLMHATGIKAIEAHLCIALRGRDGTGPNGDVFWGDHTILKSNPVAMDIPLPSGTWQMAAAPCQGWPRFNPLTSVPFLAGILLSLFFSVMFFQVLHISQGRANEIGRRKATEVVLLQKNRALRLFSQSNSAVVHAIDEQSLFSEICRIAVESAGYCLAWVGRAEQDPQRTVKPIAFAGPGEGFLDKIWVSWGDNENGRGTAGTAIRTKKPSIARGILHNPDFKAWHETLKTRNYASAIAVPLIVDEIVFGVVLIYASEPDAFDSTEVDLLEELGSNISYGIMAIRSKKERAEALLAVERARNELEERVIERTEELYRAKEAAESADRLKSAFLATMSHELRTPLNSIIGFTGIILQGLVGEITAEQKKQLTMVRDSAHHLLALINDVLDISKIEADQLEIRKELYPIQQSIDQSIQVVLPLARKKSLPIVSNVDSVPLLVYSDRHRVEQVLINLLNNAVKFTDVGGITISVSTSGSFSGKITDGPAIIISIRDTGIGIKSEDMDTLFKPFRQIDTGTTRRYEGTGLGLSICKKLAGMLGGDIQVYSGGPGAGSTFSFMLPEGVPKNG